MRFKFSVRREAPRGPAFVLTRQGTGLRRDKSASARLWRDEGTRPAAGKICRALGVRSPEGVTGALSAI
jgi:hypothetical protein